MKMVDNNKKISDNNIKNMAQLLKDGNTMLDITCPQCNAPLFKLKNGDVYCGNCQQKIVILKDEDALASYNKTILLSDIDDVLYTKILSLNNLIKQESNLDEQSKLVKLLYNYLLIIEKLKEIKKI